MNFELSDDQRMLADTVANFARQSSPIERMRKLRENERGWDPAVWKQMAELGWLGVPFPEEAGGLGGSFVEVAVILERLAKTLVPEPYIPSVVLAGHALRTAGTPEQWKKWLVPMIEGQTSLALAYAERGAGHDVLDTRTAATKDGAQYLLTGKKEWVLNGHAADHLIVSARAGDEIGLFALDRAAKGVRATPVKTMDGRHAAMIDFDGAPAERLGQGDARNTLERVIDYGAAAACAEGAGLVQTMLEMTLEYLRTREQFGVKIGSFQVLQHRAVDMFVEAELCKSMAMWSSVYADEERREVRAPAISAAKVQLATGGKYVAQQAVQLHGGIGVTDEHDIGLFFKRAYALNALFGDAEHHVARFASFWGRS